MSTEDRDEAIAAARRGAERFCDLLAGADRPDAIAVGGWRVRGIGAHLTGVSLGHGEAARSALFRKP